MPAKLEFKKRVAADLLGCGVNRVRFDQERLDEISEAITREEIRFLIKDGAIYKAPEKGTSRRGLGLGSGRRGSVGQGAGRAPNIVGSLGRNFG